MDVRFLRGLSTAYQAIASKDSKTFYFTTDDNKLYLGDVCLSNQPVEERIKVIEEHGYVNGGEVDGKISAAIANYYTKGEINDLIAGLSVGSIDGRVTALEGKVTAIEAWDSKDITAADIEAWNAEKGSKAIIDANKATWDKAGTALQAADKEELEGKITAHENAVNTKFNDYRTSADQDVIDNAQTKALNDYKAEMVETLKGYQTTIPAETYDAYGSAATAEANAKGYADKKLEDFEKAYITEDGGAIDKLNEIAGWIADDESGAVKIISDVATNAADIKNIKESAPMTSGITAAKVEGYDATKSTVDANKATWDKAGAAVQPGDLAPYAKTADISADIAKGVEAQGWGNHANQGYAKTADISEDIAKGVEANALALEINGRLPDVIGHLTTKDTIDSADLVNDKVITKAKLEDSVQASLALADRALQAHQDISHLAKQADLESLQNQHDTFENKINTSAVFTSGITADLVAQITTNKETIAQNAQTCQSNFNTISEQLTWGSF